MVETESPSLFEAARRGESWAQDEVNRLIRSFARYACRGGGPSRAPDCDWEDVAQEASVKFFSTGIHRFRGGGSEKSYLYSIVKVTAIQMSRSAARRRRREEAKDWEEALPPHNPAPILDVQAILARLDTRCRDLLRRVFLQGVPYAELAAEMRLAESSVRAKVSRCVRRARELVA